MLKDAWAWPSNILVATLLRCMKCCAESNTRCHRQLSQGTRPAARGQSCGRVAHPSHARQCQDGQLLLGLANGAASHACMRPRLVLQLLNCKTHSNDGFGITDASRHILSYPLQVFKGPSMVSIDRGAWSYSSGLVWRLHAMAVCMTCLILRLPLRPTPLLPHCPRLSTYFSMFSSISSAFRAPKHKDA